MTKPVSGAGDLISFTLQGLAGDLKLRGGLCMLSSVISLTGCSDVVLRARNPRFVDPITSVTPLYNVTKADGAVFLQRTFPELQGDVYLDHCTLRSGNPQTLLFCLLHCVVVVRLNGKKCEIAKNVDIANVLNRESLENGSIELRLRDSSSFLIQVESAQFGQQATRMLGSVLNMTHDEDHHKVCHSTPLPAGHNHMQITTTQCHFERSCKHVQDMASAVTAAPASRTQQQEMVDIWENERYYPLRGWTKSLLPADPAPFLSRGETKSYSSLAQVTPRQDWMWTSEWAVNTTGMPHDRDGWQYGVSFNLPLGGWTAHNGWADVVRRRLWSRLQKPAF